MIPHPAYYKFKSDLNRDRFGTLLHLVFPILISQAVVHLWGRSNLDGFSIALGYTAWDFFSRILLDASKLHSRYNLASDTNIDLRDIISENVYLIIIKTLISVLLTSAFYLNAVTTGLLFLFFIIPPIAYFIFLVTVIFSSAFDIFSGAVTIYCRIGLYISPIFWQSNNNFLLFNPSVLIIDIFRITSGSSSWISISAACLVSVICVVFSYYVYINGNRIKSLVCKKYIRTM